MAAGAGWGGRCRRAAARRSGAYGVAHVTRRHARGMGRADDAVGGDDGGALGGASESTSSGSDGEGDLELELGRIQSALRQAELESEEAIRAELQRTRVDNRSEALRRARMEQQDEAQARRHAEARARARAEASVGQRARDDRVDMLMGSLLGDADAGESDPAPPQLMPEPEPEPEPRLGSEDNDAGGAFAQRGARRLQHVRTVQAQADARKAQQQWKKAIKTPLQVASLAQKVDSGATGKAHALWGQARKVKAVASAAFVAQEISAEMFNAIRCATHIQAHCRAFLARRRLGMGPGDSLQDESTRQLAQTLLTERRLASLMAQLSDEARVGVAKMGTQLANMAKDTVFNNAAEHLLLCIKSKSMSTVVTNFALADGSGIRPIHNACRFKNASLTKFLLNRAAELNLRDNAGLTPLHHACVPPFPGASDYCDSNDDVPTFCTATAEALLAKSAMKSVPDNRGFTALHLVISECATHINFFHINPNDKDAAACAKCCFRMMQYLVDAAHCSLQSSDNDGNSMLGTCCQIGGPGGVDVASWLLDRHADIEHRNAEGKTPFFLALEHGHGDVAALLRDCGANQNAIDMRSITPKEHALFLRRITNLLYCSDWPKDYMDSLKEEKLWTGTEASQPGHRQSRKLTPTEKQQLKHLEDLINSRAWTWGNEPPAAFTEFHNPSHRDFESPFEVFDPHALGSLLYYDSIWVQMDDEGRSMVRKLDIDCGLFFVPLARGTWRCTWPGRLLGSEGQAEWVLEGGLKPLQSFRAHDRGITSIATVATSVSGNRDLLATISEGVNAKVWDVNAMKCAATLVGHRERLTCIICAANLVFTGSTDQTIRKWELSKTVVCGAVMRGHTGSVTALDTDSAAIWLVSGSHDGTVRVWHVLTATCVAVLGGSRVTALGESSDFPRSLILEESRSFIYSGLHNGAVQVWSLHRQLVPIKRPALVNRTKPKLLLPDRPHELVNTARQSVAITRSKLIPASTAMFDTWYSVDPSDQTVLLPGCKYIYTLKIKNYGAPLKDLVIKDMLETGMGFVECRPVAATINTTRTFNNRCVLHWRVAKLGLAEEASLKVFIRADVQGKFARSVQLVKPTGLAAMRLSMIGGKLHCGFQGGDVVQLRIEYSGKRVSLRTIFNSPPPDDDPWSAKKETRCERFCTFCRRGRQMCWRCRSKAVTPRATQLPARVVDTHFLHQMTDKVGDLEKGVLVTGLDGDTKWTSFCVGKEVHSRRGKKLSVTNYHPISVRTLDVTNGSMAVGYSDGVVRVWPMMPPKSWEQVDLVFVLWTNLVYSVLLVLLLPFFWRSSKVIRTITQSFCCGSCYVEIQGTTRRRLILDAFVAALLDIWALLLCTAYICTCPNFKQIQHICSLKVDNFRAKPDALRLEVRDTLWVRLDGDFARLSAVAECLTSRCAGWWTRFEAFCRDMLYGGHSSQIVAFHALGNRMFSVCKSGVICEWCSDSISERKAQWKGRTKPACMQSLVINKRLTTLWVGTDHGFVDVRNADTGDMLCTFDGESLGSVTCFAVGRMNQQMSMYIGWQTGSILKTQLSQPEGPLQIRNVNVLATLDGHVTPVKALAVHDHVVYSCSRGRVLAHSIQSHQCLVSFNDSDSDTVSGFCFWKGFMILAHNFNVLIWDLNESLHRKDPMGLNNITIEGIDGKQIATKSAKLETILEGHTAMVTTLATSKVSIFSGSGDGTVREWKLSHPWECLRVYDSQFDRVQDIVVAGSQLFCSFPDGAMQAWRLGEDFSLGRMSNNAKLKKTTAATLQKLLREAKASQRDMTELTSAPCTGRSADIMLDPPVAIMSMACFSSPGLDGRVYVGLQNGEIHVLQSSTAEQLAVIRCGNNSSVAWMVLEVFAMLAQLIQLVGLAFCIDGVMWSYSGAELRSFLGPYIFRARGYHAPAFQSIFAKSLFLCFGFTVMTVAQVQCNFIGNLVLRSKYCLRPYIYHSLVLTSSFCWVLVWLGSTVLLIPATRGLSAVFDCTFNCWQGVHALHSCVAAVTLIVYVPLAARLSCVHGDVLRLARGRLFMRRIDAYRDDKFGFLPTFSVQSDRTWVLWFLTLAKAVAAFLSAVVKIPSLGAFVLCAIACVLIFVAVWASPYVSRNGNLVLLGCLFVFGASAGSAFQSAWYQDWQFDLPALWFISVWLPLLFAPLVALNFTASIQCLVAGLKWLVRLTACLSISEFKRRKRKKEVQSKIKAAVKGSSALMGLLSESCAGPPKMTLLQRMQAAQNEAALQATDGTRSSGSTATTMLKSGSPPQAPADKHIRDSENSIHSTSRRWKKVSLASKLGVAPATDATVLASGQQRLTRCQRVKLCCTKKGLHECAVACLKYRDPQEIADAVKQAARRLSMACRRCSSTVHPTNVLAYVIATIKSISQRQWCSERSRQCAKQPGKSIERALRFVLGYMAFVCYAIKAWALSLRCSRWISARLPQRPDGAPPRCATCKSRCRRWYQVMCRGHVAATATIAPQRQPTDFKVHDSRFLSYWVECNKHQAETQEAEERKQKEQSRHKARQVRKEDNLHKRRILQALQPAKAEADAQFGDIQDLPQSIADDALSSA